MRDDTILTAIDEALGAATVCHCGKELLLGQHDDILWLECPVFAAPSLLPATIAAAVRGFTHDRRVVAALPAAPVAVAAPVVVPVAVAAPVVVSVAVPARDAGPAVRRAAVRG